MSLEQKFKASCERIKTFKKKPEDGEMLEVYSLYKQATIGDADIQTKMNDPVGKAKWAAWHGKKGLKPEVAKEKYIAKVNELAINYEK